MTKRVFTPATGWTVIEDAPARTDGSLKAPASVMEEAPEPQIDMTQLPFKRVLNNHLIIHIDPYMRPKGQKTHVPDSAKRASTKGRVIAIAKDITDIEVGDKVLYSQYAGYLLRFEGFPLMRVIAYTEVLSVLNDDSPEISMEGA